MARTVGSKIDFRGHFIDAQSDLDILAKDLAGSGFHAGLDQHRSNPDVFVVGQVMGNLLADCAAPDDCDVLDYPAPEVWRKPSLPRTRLHVHVEDISTYFLGF
jgi:hypothetical protein